MNFTASTPFAFGPWSQLVASDRNELLSHALVLLWRVKNRGGFGVDAAEWLPPPAPLEGCLQSRADDPESANSFIA